jgi:DNA-binding MarR family transcriptional regulator
MKMLSKNELLKLRRSEILLLRLLKERAVNNEVSISRGEIAEEINYSKAMITKAMRTLEKLGYIKTESGLGSTITKFTILKEEE